MQQYTRINSNGSYIEPILFEDGAITDVSGTHHIDDPDIIKELPPDGLFSPKWDGTQWVEGLSQEEIDARQNAPQVPSLEDRLKATEDAITALLGL